MEGQGVIEGEGNSILFYKRMLHLGPNTNRHLFLIEVGKSYFPFFLSMNFLDMPCEFLMNHLTNA